MSLTVKEFSVNEVAKKYIGSPSMREYWREQKRLQRAKVKVQKQHGKVGLFPAKE